jgi:hypothetical protein
MGRMEFPGGFEFQDDQVLDHDIGCEGAYYLLVVDNQDFFFFLGLKPGFVQFMEQSVLIDAFQKTKGFLYLAGAVDYFGSQFFVEHGFYFLARVTFGHNGHCVLTVFAFRQ